MLLKLHFSEIVQLFLKQMVMFLASQSLICVYLLYRRSLWVLMSRFISHSTLTFCASCLCISCFCLNASSKFVSPGSVTPIKNTSLFSLSIFLRFCLLCLVVLSVNMFHSFGCFVSLVLFSPTASVFFLFLCSYSTRISF